jgi:hypothetical protein
MSRGARPDPKDYTSVKGRDGEGKRGNSHAQKHASFILAQTTLMQSISTGIKYGSIAMVGTFVFCATLNSMQVDFTLDSSADTRTLPAMRALLFALVGGILTSVLSYCIPHLDQNPFFVFGDILHVSIRSGYTEHWRQIFALGGFVLFAVFQLLGAGLAALVMFSRTTDLKNIGLPKPTLNETSVTIAMYEGIVCFMYSIALSGMRHNYLAALASNNGGYVTVPPKALMDASRDQDDGCPCPEETQFLLHAEADAVANSSFMHITRGFLFAIAIFVTFPITGGVINPFRFMTTTFFSLATGAVPTFGPVMLGELVGYLSSYGVYLLVFGTPFRKSASD